MANVLFEFEQRMNTKNIDSLFSGSEEILIGIPSGPTTANGVEFAQLAEWLSYGTATIPARPFLEEGILDGKAEITKQIQRHYEKKIAGQDDEEGLHRIGVAAVGHVKEFVMSGHYRETVPNAESTIYKKSRRQKGKVLLSDVPLVDTGQMIGMVTYVVRQE